MSMRISNSLLPLALLALAGCSEPDQPKGAGDVKTASEAQDDGRVVCAIGEGTEFQRVCLLERARIDDRLQLVIWHPDGGFRRFNVVTDGRGLEAADGAEVAKVTLLPDKMIEVAVDSDRYRLPATLKNAAN